MSEMNPVPLIALLSSEYMPLPGPPLEKTEPEPNSTCKTVIFANHCLDNPGDWNPKNILVE